MKKINIEKSLKGAINQAPTVDFEKLAIMPVVKMAEHDYITRQQENRKPNTFRGFSVAVSFCFVILVCFSGWFTQYRLPNSVIALDVNPSIEIVTNKQDHILSVKALNEDAKRIIGDQDYNNADLSSTVDTLLASMISQGYLNNNKNTIMISVENKDIKKAEGLALLLDAEIQKSASSQSITPHILRQVFTKDKEASAFAGRYNISVGKMKLIQAIMSSNASFSIDKLAGMSMEDLLSISKEYAIDLHKIIQSDDDYSDAGENGEYTQPANTDQKANDNSPSITNEDINDSSQSTTDQNTSDSSQSTTDQNTSDSSQSTTDQNTSDSSPSNTDQNTSDSSPSNTDQNTNNGSSSTIDQTGNDSSKTETDITKNDKTDGDSANPSNANPNENNIYKYER